jgi:predicted DNA-binding ribbon-helix-helix protein
VRWADRCAVGGQVIGQTGSQPETRNRPGRRRKRSAVLIRTLYINGRKTNVSLEDGFWKALEEIATAREITVSGLISTIANKQKHENLSSMIRQFVLSYYNS